MNISIVCKEGRCMCCGMCSSVCPVNAIKMVYNSNIGFYCPIVDDDRCISCNKCQRYCPAENRKDLNTLIGSYQKIFLAHSTKFIVRKMATSGGVVNSLVRYLVNKDLVDGVLMVGYSRRSPIEAEPIIITKENVQVLLEMPRDFASRYVSVPVLSLIREVSKSMKRFAVVGTSCQIRALSINGIIDADIIKIGIACSGGISYKATEEYKKSKNLQKSKIYYRGDGWPGKNSLIQNENNIEYSHPGSLFEKMFSSQVFKNSACRVCYDHFAEEAEISFCDFWNEQELQTETKGNSCVIIRSQRVMKIFHRMIQEGYVEVVRELTENEVINTQTIVLKGKKGNLHNIIYYKIFIKIIDFIFRHQIYRKFNIHVYKVIGKLYRGICDYFGDI